ncbi:MAG: Uma2 family endonuclease [Gemmataceae bacterium]
MSVTSGTIWSGPPPYPVRPFSVDEYHRLIHIGLLTEDDPVELLEGWIVPKMPRNELHDVALDLVQEPLRARLPAGYRLRVQSAITTLDSEPEPDFAIVPGPATRFLAHHPLPAEIELLVEVSDSTLNRDRTDKGRLYARAGIAVYWIVNLVDRQIEVYTDPTGPDPVPAYRIRQEFGINDSVPLQLGGLAVDSVPVRELMP